MKNFIEIFFNLKFKYIIIILILMYSISLTIEYLFIFTDSFYEKAFNGLPINNIEDIILNEKKIIWANYLFILLVIFIPSLLVAFCLNIGTILKDYKISFKNIFDISVKSQIIFSVNYFIATLTKSFGLLKRDFSNINNNFDFQSMLIFFNTQKIPFWLIYPLEKINLPELCFILLLAGGLNYKLQMGYKKSILFTLLFYGSGLLIWIIFTVFLQTIYST